MVDLVLISHGEFCEGCLSSLKMIMGDNSGIKAVPLFPGETVDTYRAKLAAAINADNEDGTLILSDIMSGTPFQSAAYLSKDYKIGLVSGMNMPMILTAAMERADSDLEQLVSTVTDPDSLGISGSTFKKGDKKKREKLSINKN